MTLSFIDIPPTEISTLSLHDALPISSRRPGDLERGADPQELRHGGEDRAGGGRPAQEQAPAPPARSGGGRRRDRKSTRLNSSHANISYAVFCLKKKNGT